MAHYAIKYENTGRWLKLLPGVFQLVEVDNPEDRTLFRDHEAEFFASLLRRDGEDFGVYKVIET